jgi:2-polyprenyl-6-hydroxyphenyl methylase/3-demethylubiquinone-9 3-methyltransferase
MEQSRGNIDSLEIERFELQADDWWDPRGPLKALHDINSLRFEYIDGRCPVEDKKILDIGCGGGILSEPLAVAGGEVTGIDMAAGALRTARHHMEKTGVTIEYRRATAETLAGMLPDHFDLVICMELLEHVPQPDSMIRACAQLVKKGGDIMISTINRTWLAYALVVFAAENILKIVRKGTHTYSRLVKPREIRQWAQNAGLAVNDLTGFAYNPFSGSARFSKLTLMNYMMHLKKPL